MTDIPELQHLLIDAAARRSRARRRAKGVRAVALVAVVALAVVALPRIDGQDVEIPAVPPPTPTATPTTIEAAYGVFRRPSRPTDRVELKQMPGAETRRIAKTSKVDVFLAAKGERVCVAVERIAGRATDLTCGPQSQFLGGHRLLGATTTRPNSLAFAFPDGVRSVTFTREDGHRTSFVVISNGVTVQPPSPIVKAEWTAPDGQPQHANFFTKTLAAQDLYVALNAAPGPAGELQGLPGSRRVLEAGSASAWLVPRQNAVCLVLKVAERTTSGCRSPVTETRHPIVVSLPGGAGERVVAAAFADVITRSEVTPEAGIVRLSKGSGVLLWSDRGEARTLRYRGAARGSASTAVPAVVEGFVLSARPRAPETIP
jgi:hypothetical protein